jgi:hypothetical protein
MEQIKAFLVGRDLSNFFYLKNKIEIMFCVAYPLVSASESKNHITFGLKISFAKGINLP